jgi:hypothetical protein
MEHAHGANQGTETDRSDAAGNAGQTLFVANRKELCKLGSTIYLLSQ